MASERFYELPKERKLFILHRGPPADVFNKEEPKL